MWRGRRTILLFLPAASIPRPAHEVKIAADTEHGRRIQPTCVCASISSLPRRAVARVLGHLEGSFLNILLIDDSMVIRKMLRRVLGECGLGIKDIYEAGDGSQGLKQLEANQVNLILCDVNMPVMGGLEFLEAISKRAEWSHIPVIMVTTEGGMENVIKAVQLGAKGYIHKPFTTDEVKQKLVQCLNTAVA
jgi:two-component system chemotaxis response regulator CheY